MTTIVKWLPVLSSIITLIFAGAVFRRYLWRRGLHLLLWAIGLTMYAIGALAEAQHTVLGWNALAFRLWYLLGAMLVAAWLGQGTVYLLVENRVAHIFMSLLVIGSLYGAIRVFSASLDPTLLPEGELSGRAIVTPGVRLLTPFFNTYGLITLVGGAIYSAWHWRAMPNRAVGNILIALGALAPALGGLLSRLGLLGYLYVSELLGSVLTYVGFVRCTSRAPSRSDVGPRRQGAELPGGGGSAEGSSSRSRG